MSLSDMGPIERTIISTSTTVGASYKIVRVFWLCVVIDVTGIIKANSIQGAKRNEAKAIKMSSH